MYNCRCESFTHWGLWEYYFIPVSMSILTRLHPYISFIHNCAVAVLLGGVFEALACWCEVLNNHSDKVFLLLFAATLDSILQKPLLEHCSLGLVHLSMYVCRVEVQYHSCICNLDTPVSLTINTKLLAKRFHKLHKSIHSGTIIRKLLYCHAVM